MTRRKQRSMKIPMAVGAAIFVALLIILPLIFENADAVTKQNIEDSRSRIQQSEDKVKNLEEKITEKRIQLIDLEADVRKNQEDVKKTRVLAFDSWEYIPELERLEKVLTQSQNKLKQENLNYQKLVSEKNHAESNHRKLIKYLEEIELLYIKENKPNLSGLKSLIGIKLSDACLTTIKNNIDNPCHVTYRDLLQFDSSDRSKSGRFTTDDNGFFHRGKPQYQNDCRLYDNDNQLRILVDPSSHCQTRIPMIEIRPNFDTYFLRDGLTQAEEFEMIDVKINDTFSKKTKTIQVRNQTQDFGMIIYHDRYIEKCKLAYINADKWQLLLADTIHHIRSKCTDSSTSFNEKEVIYLNRTQHDISTSNDFKHKEWLSYVKAFCIFKYKACQE